MARRHYYSIPLDTEKFFSAKGLRTSDLKESIATNIHLILVTRYGEYDFDSEFGCEIWDRDFDILPNTGLWTKELADKLSSTLRTYEPRLKNFKVKAEVLQVEKPYGSEKEANKQMRRQLTVTIDAKLVSTEEAFFFRDKILISPFAID